MDYFLMSVEDEKSSKTPIVVMIDDSSGRVYARGTGRKVVADMGWLIEDMSEELKSWGAHRRLSEQTHIEEWQRDLHRSGEGEAREVPRGNYYT